MLNQQSIESLKKMSKLWGEIVEKLNPYTPGEQPNDLNLMKLNTNENPYGPSPHVLKNIKNKCNDSLRLYPDPESIELKKSLVKSVKGKVKKQLERLDLPLYYVKEFKRVLRDNFRVAFASQIKNDFPFCFIFLIYFYPVK